MKSSVASKERLKVNLEKLKISVTIIVLLTGGLISLMYKNLTELFNVALFISGIITEIIFLLYIVNLNRSIENLLITLEEGKDD